MHVCHHCRIIALFVINTMIVMIFLCFNIIVKLCCEVGIALYDEVEVVRTRLISRPSLKYLQ
jgi:hypothetical protein